MDLQHIAAQAELAAVEIVVAAAVLDIDQAAGDRFEAGLVTDLEQHHLGQIFLRRTEAVDAGDAGDDDHVAARQQGGGSRMAQTVDLLVDGAVLLDIGVRRRQIGFRLIIIVIADKVLDGVVGQEFLELVAELGGQGLVVGHDQRRLFGAGDDLGHGEGLAGTGDAEQRLIAVAAGRRRRRERRSPAAGRRWAGRWHLSCIWTCA